MYLPMLSSQNVNMRRKQHYNPALHYSKGVSLIWVTWNWSHCVPPQVMDGLRLVSGLHWIPAYKENQLFFYLGSLNSGLNPSVSLVLLTGLYDAAVGCTLCTKERGRFSCFTAASQSMINYLCNFFWFSQVLMERNYLSIISLFIGSNNNNNNNLSSTMLCCQQSQKVCTQY